MITILVTCRVDYVGSYNETRDAIDQSWIELLLHCGFFPILVPNSIEWITHFLKHRRVDGVLLTGGNDIVSCNGTYPVRDEVETILLEFALINELPVLGVCRGMQLLVEYFGGSLSAVENQVLSEQKIMYLSQNQIVNSYHHFGVSKLPKCFKVTATTEDNQHIKAISHQTKNISGIMWHPERILPFDEFNISFLKSVFL